MYRFEVITRNGGSGEAEGMTTLNDETEKGRGTFDGKSRRNSNGARVFRITHGTYRFRYTECACAVPRRRRPKTTLSFFLFSTSFSLVFLPQLDSSFLAAFVANPLITESTTIKQFLRTQFQFFIYFSVFRRLILP